MSTYLSPPSLEKWLKVGELSYERKMYNQAAYCFGRALKLSTDPAIMSRRAAAFEKAGEFRKAIATYRRLLRAANSPEWAKQYAKLRYRRGEYSLCRDILTGQKDFILDSSLVNLTCQTYLKEKVYDKAAELLEEHLRAREEVVGEAEELPV